MCFLKVLFILCVESPNHGFSEPAPLLRWEIIWWENMKDKEKKPNKKKAVFEELPLIATNANLYTVKCKV